MPSALDVASPLARELYWVLASVIEQETGRQPLLQDVVDYSYLKSDSLLEVLQVKTHDLEELKNLTPGQLSHALTDMRHHITLWLATRTI